MGELGDADGLRDYVVLVDWRPVWTTRGVADVIFKDEVVEPNSFAAAILGAVSKEHKVSFVYLSRKRVMVKHTLPRGHSRGTIVGSSFAQPGSALLESLGYLGHFCL